MTNEDLKSELNIGQQLCSALLGVTTFFTGIMIASFNSFSTTIRVPIVLLIVSVFSFLVALLAYSNGFGELRRNRGAKKFNIQGNALSEFGGIYNLFFAVPLVVNAVSSDRLLQVATFAAACLAFGFYQFSRISLLGRYVGSVNEMLISVLLIGLNVGLFVSQTMSPSLFFPIFCGILVAAETGLIVVALARGE